MTLRSVPKIAGMAGLALGTLLGTAPAAAQCTTCSPLSLPSGSLVGQDLATARQATFSLQGQATSGWVGFPQQVADNQPIQTRESARFDLFLTTVSASAIHRSGLGLDVAMPFGWLASRTGAERRQDFSLGDAEVKPRATTVLARAVRLTGSLGAALPTGSYTSRSGPGALGDASRSLAIGRGVFWGVAEVEARWEPARRLAFTSATQGRLPVGEAADGFRWGPELRTLAETEVRIAGPIAVAVGGEVAARAGGSIVDPFLGQRVDSTNVAATTVSVVPSVRASFERGFFLSATGRLPVYQDLEGLQFRQGPGLFLGAGIVLPVGGTSSADGTATLASGEILVREYAADWCGACRKLEPIFAAAQRRGRKGVRFERVDVTEWSEGDLERRVPGAKALPVVEMRRSDGSLVALLTGDEAFSFQNQLEEKTR